MQLHLSSKAAGLKIQSPASCSALPAAHNPRRTPFFSSTQPSLRNFPAPRPNPLDNGVAYPIIAPPSHVTSAKKKGGKGGASVGGGKPAGGNGTATKYKSPGDVREGGAYTQETRKIILSLQKIRKVTPNGKEILKNINLGMYLGAKIGVLGANGSGKSSLMRILAGVDQSFEGDVNRSPGETHLWHYLSSKQNIYKLTVHVCLLR